MMRPDSVFACIEFGAEHATYMERQMDEHVGWLIICFSIHRISPWPKTAEKRGKRGFCTCVTDVRTDGWTDRRKDRQTDRPSYTDAFLTDASKNEWGGLEHSEVKGQIFM